MNFLLGLALCTLSIIVSTMISNSTKNKQQFFCDFASFVQSFCANCSYKKQVFWEWLKTQQGIYSSEFNQFLVGLNSDIDIKKYVIEYSQKRKFDISESDILVRFFEALGHFDEGTQLVIGQATQQQIMTYCDSKRENTNKQSILTKKMGIMCGLALFIIVL